MKPKLLLLLFFLLPSFSFCQWYYQNPKPVGALINRVKLVDKNIGWVVGQGGVLLKTVDGGVTWQQTPNLQAGTLCDLFIYDSLTAWTVGVGLPQAVIFKTNDAWKSNTKITFPTTKALLSVFFTSKFNGWVCGDSGIILKTSDGGQTWEFKHTGTQVSLYSISFFNDNVGIAVGSSGVILRSTDGGETWTKIMETTGSQLNGISMINDTSAWLSDFSGYLMHTNDGGLTWKEDTTVLDGFTEVNFTDSLCGWATPISGYNILKTTDGGSTWNICSTGTSASFRSIDFADRLNGCAVGGAGNIITTNDGGLTWQSRSSGTQVQLYGIASYNNNCAWAVGEQGVILNTRDGGENWSLQNSGAVLPLRDIMFLTPLKGWAVGDHNIVIFTEDGGNTWQNLQQDSIYGWFKKVFFVDANNGWICGENNTMYHTSDGGITWRLQSVLAGAYLNDVYFIDQYNGWAVGSLTSSGSTGIIMSTSNGGDTWQRQSDGVVSNFRLNSVQFISKDTGFAAGNVFSFYRTFDGGNHWEYISLVGLMTHVYDVHFRNSKEGWLIGTEGVFFTNDGGLTFNNQVPIRMEACSFVDANTGWIVGHWGVIMKTTNGGFPLGIEKEEPLPISQALESTVFPNPVSPNSSVKILYQQPEDGLASVFLFDIHGREILRKSLGFQNTGEHCASLSTASLLPGLYFVQIRINTAVINRKIIVL